MKLYFDGATDTGLVRSANQDAYYIDPEGRFFIVADGMGGHAGGEEASHLAARVVREYLEAQWQTSASSQSLLEAALLKANESIIEDQKEHPERADMGTTAVVMVFRSEQVGQEPQPWCAHVGDSRLYRLRGAKLEQVTEDHTWVNKASKMGVITPDQIKTHPWRHVLSQCLGRPDLAEVAIQRLDVVPGDRLLLCSDGLTEEVSDHLIAELLKTVRACEKVTTKLIESAKEHGGRDNITVVAIATDIHDESYSSSSIPETQL
ncbi:MAG: serine/threonine-protein phosphatase [Synechococcales cyanobacterium RM1_1_8]|nr:serine/threonine-protein phosphatase [Synechococcales cyanobacterium RM1_1_8]